MQSVEGVHQVVEGWVVNTKDEGGHKVPMQCYSGKVQVGMALLSHLGSTRADLLGLTRWLSAFR